MIIIVLLWKLHSPDWLKLITQRHNLTLVCVHITVFVFYFASYALVLKKL